MKQFVLLGMTLCTLTSCYHSSETRSAAGVKSDDSYAWGLVSISKVNTTIGQKDCEAALQTFRTGEEPLLRADVYSPCFAVGMMDPEQAGQLPPPIPRDLDGDGHQDAVQYPNGMLVPANLFSMYPGVYWPQVYAQYGITPEAMQGVVGQQFGHITAMRHRGYLFGYPGDPIAAGTPDEVITRGKLDAELAPIEEEVNANSTDIIMGAQASEGDE